MALAYDNFSIDACWKIKFTNMEVNKIGKFGWNQIEKVIVLFVVGSYWIFLSWGGMQSDQSICEGWTGREKTELGEQLDDAWKIEVRIKEDIN